MARIEDTGGIVTYTIPNCDCGLTGGCWMCQPLHVPFIGTPYKIDFMGNNLREFYRKSGLLYDSEL